MGVIVEKLRLNDLNCCIASDLKLINALLGISSHSGKFSCPYCTGEMSLECGESRTFESLAKNNAEFVANGSKMRDMKNFKNVIHPSLLKGELASKVLSSVPPPELHLLMGGVNWGLEQLFQVMDNATLKEKMRSKGISVRGYQGGRLDGVNSNIFLKHLDFLLEGAPEDALVVKEMLSSLRAVQQSCFTIDLGSSYKEDLALFKSSVQKVIEHTRQTRNKILKPTWKIHIHACHVEPFLDEKQVGLGIFCEQTCESSDCVLKPTVQRFKRKVDHRDQGDRLLRAVGDFSSKAV